jgi:hypothetical protein
MLMMNASDRVLDFALPRKFRWQLLIDSAEPQEQSREIPDKSYKLQDRAAAIFVAKLEGEKREAAE